MKPPTVVNVAWQRYDLYIGYPSKWCNPYRSGRDGTKEEVLVKYEDHVIRHEGLYEDLKELDGVVLGCHCAPRPCHGDVLVKLFIERFGA